jgi:metallo-beta-lactamase family protein
MHLVEFGNRRVLLDCGLVRGRRDEARRHNGHFPFDPETIDAVILSHAHVDHSGNLPHLVRQGFEGPIYCTPATRDLVAIMLDDSARIQEEEAAVAAVVGRAGSDGGRLAIRVDARRAIEQCVPVPYDHPLELFDSARLRFLDAGHILGSAVTRLTVEHQGREHSLTFTGDLGRRGLPFLRHPPTVPAGDLIISESTYGGKVHDTLDRMATKMAEVVERTAERNGKVLIPAFSLGRTQVVLHFLRRWTAEGLLPELPLFVDSPLAERIEKIHDRYSDLLQGDPATEPGPEPQHLRTSEEVEEATTMRGPAIIVASGGTCDGGRIMRHLRHHIDDPRASVVLVSYQPPHSLGARLLERGPTVRFHGRTWNKWCEVVQISGFSGHADQNDFLALLGPAAAEAQRVRLVHGEPEQAQALAEGLGQAGARDVMVPEHGETTGMG